jgi:hypothetical protein
MLVNRRLDAELLQTRVLLKPAAESVNCPTGCVYDFPTSSEGKFPDIVDLEKKRQYTPFRIETITDSKRRNLSWKQYTTPPEPISDD